MTPSRPGRYAAGAVACLLVGVSCAQPSRAELPRIPPNAPGGSCLPAPVDSGSKQTPYGGPWLDRPKLTGDWFGCRDDLRDQGITLDVSTTQYYQGVARGGLEQSFPYGGRNDYFLTLYGEKLGLWKGFSVKLHGETRYGESANLITGALLPVNLQLALPVEEGTVTALTAVLFSQYLSDNLVVYAGKYTTIDGYPQPLTWANRDNGFLNTAQIFNPIDYRTVPYVTYGAGLTYSLKDDPVPVFIFEVLDTNNTPTTSGFDTFFDNGATLFTHLNIPTRFFGKPGHQGVSGVYSTGRYTNLSPSSYLVPVNELVFRSAPKRGSWFVGYNFDQALWVAADDPKRVWGVFGTLGLADDNPSPIRWFASAGVAGASPLPGRKADTFGVAFWHIGISGPLKASARPFSPLENEQGVEVYYNARMTPWFQLTPDLQIIEPFQKNAETAIVVGFRAKLDF